MIGHAKKFSRREALAIGRNLGVATFAGGMMFPGGLARAQAKAAVLGHFGSANPQTFAKATGAFAKALGSSVNTSFATVNAGPQIIAAMAGNSMDICNIGSSPMVVAFANDIDISMVYIEKIITDSECLAVRKDANISSVKDLKGKKIGMPFNTSVHFAALAMLKNAGLGASDVTLVNIKPDAILAAWGRKDIDAAYIWYPVLSDLVKDNGSILFKSGDLADKGTLVFDGIIVRNKFKRENPDLVLAYLKEYENICAIYRNKPEQVVEVMGSFLSMPPDKAKEYVASFYSLPPKEIATDKWMGLPGSKETGVLKTLRDQAEFLKAADQLAKVPESFAPWVDQSFVAKMI